MYLYCSKVHFGVSSGVSFGARLTSPFNLSEAVKRFKFVLVPKVSYIIRIVYIICMWSYYMLLFLCPSIPCTPLIYMYIYLYTYIFIYRCLRSSLRSVWWI